MTPWIVLAIPLLVVALLLFRTFARRRKRKALLATPLTPEQRAVVERLVPLVRRMPQPLRQALEGKINLFLDQITFHGMNGIEPNEPMRLSIAAQACLLVVNTDVWYDTLRTVLVYPSTFVARRDRHEGYVVTADDLHMAGESWARGPVVLAWDHALKGGLDADDGYNVVIHEFAHQLDALTGDANGIPVLSRGQAYEGWETAMLEAYDTHVARVERGHPTLFDPYGATNHEEFFAEAIVTFFEKPRAMLREEAALYAQFSELLAIDPARWG